MLSTNNWGYPLIMSAIGCCSGITGGNETDTKESGQWAQSSMDERLKSMDNIHSRIGVHHIYTQDRKKVYECNNSILRYSGHENGECHGKEVSIMKPLGSTVSQGFRIFQGGIMSRKTRVHWAMRFLFYDESWNSFSPTSFFRLQTAFPCQF